MQNSINNLFILTLFLLAFGSEAQIELSNKSINIQSLSSAQSIVIDGELSESIWNDLKPIDDFHQVTPKEFSTPSEKTEVWVAYDENYLYVAAKLYESDMSSVKAGQLIQGRDYEFDDQFHVVIDSFNSQQSGYFFQLNANGVRRDALIDNDNFHGDWDAIWHAKTTINQGAWVVEMAIPFKSISFDPELTAWGINFGRVKKQPKEVMAWSSKGADSWEMAPQAAGKLLGIADVEQGLGLDVKISAALIQNSKPEGELNFEPSLDVFYKPSSNQTLAATFNTDFSATEVDDRVVNLSRFSVFLPEKRDFFLEDMDIFEFGQIQGNGKPFFSRRIGLDLNGQPTDLNIGIKYTGRSDLYNYGLLGVEQENDLGMSQTLFVGRAQRNVLQSSQVGVIATLGNPNNGNSDRLLGVDFKYRNSTFLENKNLTGGMWFQKSEQGGISKDNAAYGFNIDYPNDEMTLRFSSQTFEANFNPVLGFVNRRGIRESVIQGGFKRRYDDSWFEAYRPWVRLTYVTDVNDRMLSRNFVIFPSTFTSVYGDYMQSGYEALTDVFDAPFEIYPGVVLPVGRHDYGRSHVWFESSLSRKAGGSLLYRKGEFFNGKQSFLRSTLFWRPNPHVHVAAVYDTTNNQFPQGRFKTELYSLKKEVAFNSEWSWLTVVQFDNLSNSTGISSHLNWQPNELSSLNLVFKSETFKETEYVNLLDRNQMILKYSYTFRR